jgi:hypothetical protein
MLTGDSLRHHVLLWFGSLAMLVAIHAPFLRLPFHWDEMGQFVPAALDLYRDGAWVPHSAEPNIHPPGLMLVLALVWRAVGYSILSSRLTMLLLAASGLYVTFLLGIRLARGTSGAPAFAAVAFLAAAPMFYTQSMMVLLDMPAMLLTVASLLLFLDGRYLACALVTAALVFVKETAITTPIVFAGWLWFRDGRRREACYFLAPIFVLAGWLLVLHGATGSWFGNAEFARYNVTKSLRPLHILYAIFRRAYSLFFADGHWIGTIALAQGWRLMRGRDWDIALAIAGAQLAAVTFFGGAVLDRYLLPVLPILYIAFAVGASAYQPSRRLLSNVALLAFLVAGWFWNPPYTFPLENNLAVVDFVQLQRRAAEYLESNYPDREVLTAWPLTEALQHPEFGYVQNPMRIRQAEGLQLRQIRAINTNPADLIVTYSRGQDPPAFLFAIPSVRELAERYLDLQPEADAQELGALGYEIRTRWTQRGQWLAIYARSSR